VLFRSGVLRRIAAGWLLALAAGGACAFAPMSLDAQSVAQWVITSRDHGGKPFAIVDKLRARIHVFDARGLHAGSSRVLLGAASGDESLPGVGARTQTGTLRAEDRTTPAGRFESEPGRNLSGEHVVWVDYASAFAIHRVRPGRSFKTRVERLATDAADDKRVSDGCVVVPVEFYTGVIARVLGTAPGVVYVLPESRALRELFRGA
jgi:hypothetical protein